MAELDHSNTILIVKPVDPSATAALRSESNASRLVSFHFDDAPSTFSLPEDSRSREGTPYCPPASEIELHLKFKPEPKDPSRGFVFGANPTSCDIVLLDNPHPERAKSDSLSREHFAIDFNCNSGYLRVNNISRYGTGIRAPSVKNGYLHLKHNDQRMLHPAEQTRISVGSLQFDLSFPIRDQHQCQLYQANWQAFRAHCSKALPDLGSLEMKPLPDITRFKVRREGRYRAYLLHDKIGAGQYGTVCRATDDRTGELFAAKQFMTTKPEWDARAYLEIALSQKVKHEHIISFVDFIDDGGGPVIVMEYLPKGNLMDVHLKRFFSSEETRIVLHQTLRALDYLHNEKKITHRDVKPANILVQSRTPKLFLKLCDFGLSSEKSALETRCGTALYAAAEIYQKHYTNAVDIWATGVVGLQLITGLPEHNQELTPQDWCEKIRDRAKRVGRQAGRPMLLLIKRMLKLNPQDRPSARACLADPLMKSLQQRSQSDMVSNGETESLKAISEQPAQVLDPLRRVADASVELDHPTILQESRKRAQPFGFDCEGRSAKKSRTKHFTENHGDGTTVVRRSARATLRESLPEDYIVGGQSGRKMVEGRTTPDAKPTSAASEDKSRMIQIASLSKRKARDNDVYVELEVDGQVVLMRKADCMINASQMLSLAKKSPVERQQIMNLMIKKTKIEMLLVGNSRQDSWVNFQHGNLLCNYLGLNEKLQPLINYGLQFHRQNSAPVVENVDNYLVTASRFIEIREFSIPVMVSRADFRINGSNILRLAGCPRRQMQTLTKRFRPNSYEFIRGAAEIQGTYVDFDIGIELCRKYKLVELEQRLLHLKASAEGETYEAQSHHAQPAAQNVDPLLKQPTCTSIPPHDMANNAEKAKESPGQIIPESVIQRVDSNLLKSKPASSTCFSIQRNDEQGQETIDDGGDGSSWPVSVDDTKTPPDEGITPNLPAAEPSNGQYWESQPEMSRLSQVHLELKSYAELSWRYGAGTDMSSLAILEHDL